MAMPFAGGVVAGVIAALVHTAGYLLITGVVAIIV